MRYFTGNRPIYLLSVLVPNMSAYIQHYQDSNHILGNEVVWKTIQLAT